MDSSDDDSEGVPTAFMVGTSQIETQTNQDAETILRNLPALTKSPKTSESDSAKEKGILFTKRLLETSSEDEVKKQEMAKILVKDSESDMEQIKLVSETNDEKDSFSDEDIVMTQSASDANITVICKTKSSADKNKDQASTSVITSSPVVIANTFQSQGFDLVPSSQEDMFLVKDTCDDDQITPIKNSQTFHSLQLSGEPMIVPETLDQNLGDSPEIIMSTPRIIPNSPTDDSLQENDNKKEGHYDPTDIATLNEQVKEPVNISNDSKPEDSQDLALRLSPSQPYHYDDSPCHSLKYDEEVNIDNKKETNSPQPESFHLSIPSEGVLLHPTTTSKPGTSTDNDSTSPDTNKTSPSSQDAGLGKQASLDIGQIGTQSENNSDTSFHLNVPHVSGVDNISDDTNQQNVFNLAKTGSKRPKPVSTFIEESSEDVFAFEKRRKITKDDEGKREDEPMVVEDQESVDPNAETQPSNDDCSSVTGDKPVVLETEDTQLYEPDHQTKQSTSVEIIEADDLGNLPLTKNPSVIVLDSEETDSEQRNNTKYTSLLEKKTTPEDNVSKTDEEVPPVVQPLDTNVLPDQNIEPASQCSEEILQSQSLNKINEESKEQSESFGSQTKLNQSSQKNQSSLSKADSEPKPSSKSKQSSQAKPSSQTKPSSQVKADSQSAHILDTAPESQPKSNSQQDQNPQIQASSVQAADLPVDKDSTPKPTLESERLSSLSSQPKQTLHTEQKQFESKSSTKQSSQNKSSGLKKPNISQQLEKEASAEEHVHFQIDKTISQDKAAEDASKAAEDTFKAAEDASKAAEDTSKAAEDTSKAAGDAKSPEDKTRVPEDVSADPYLFHGTQSQGLLGTTVSATTGTTHLDQSTKQTTSKSPKALPGKKVKKVPAKRVVPKKTQLITETRSSTDEQLLSLVRQTTLRRKRSLSKKQSKDSDEFIRPVEPVTTPVRSRTEARSSRETPSSVVPQHGESSRPQSQRRMDFQEFTDAIENTLQKSSSSSLSSQEELEYHEVTTKYKVVDITITNKHGDVLYNKTKKEREEPIVVKRKISKEEVHQFESPRSLSSGELGDIESLSRSSGSKNSLPQSLDKTSPSLDVLSLSLQKSKSDSSQTTHIAASSIHSDIANTPNESPIGNTEMGAHTGGVEISDVIFTSPETSDTAKKQSEAPHTTKSTSPLVRKQAADSSSQDTSEIECAQRPSAASKVPDDPGFNESGGFSVRGATTSVHSSSSGRKEDITTTPTGRSSKKKTGSGRGKQSIKNRSKNTSSTSTTTTTTTTDTSKTSPEIPMIGGYKDTASTSTIPTKTTYYASNLEEGSAVMAKWKDGYYYPGTIKQIETERVKVSFDDGDVKYVKNSNVLLVKQLPIGQSVMVLSQDGYFDTGMILGHMTSDSDDSILYQVEKDNGEKHRYSHSQVILSEDQAACLMSDEELRISQSGGSHVSTHINPANVSLDNLVEGKRTRSAKKESKKDMPEPTETKRLGRKRKAREGGPMATSTPTPKGKRLQTEKEHQSPSIGTASNVLDSPSTSGNKHSPRKVRIGLFDDSTKTVDLLKNMAFILTHGVKTKEQKREEKRQLRDSDISTEESSAEEEELHPFNKHQLISIIVGCGGVILNEFNQEKINQYKCCYLISDSHHRTVKYMQALAAGLPCVSHLWIIFSSSQGKLLDYKSYILPAGINIEKKKLCEWNSRGSCLAGLNVMVNSSNKEFVSAWSSVLNISRCHLITKIPTAKSKTKLDVIITDNSCSNTVLKKSEQLSIPVVSTEWVIQCLITSHIVNYTGHPKYRHDYYDK